MRSDTAERGRAALVGRAKVRAGEARSTGGDPYEDENDDEDDYDP
jgi:hypothetical protein